MTGNKIVKHLTFHSDLAESQICQVKPRVIDGPFCIAGPSPEVRKKTPHNLRHNPIPAHLGPPWGGVKAGCKILIFSIDLKPLELCCLG
jgi:hypothetical protein